MFSGYLGVLYDRILSKSHSFLSTSFEKIEQNKLLIFGHPLFQIPNSDAVPAKPFEDCLPALMLSKSFNSGAPEEGGGQGPCPPPPPNFFRQLDLIPTRWGRSCPLYYYFPLPDFFTFLRLWTFNSIAGRGVFFCALRPLRADGI